MASSSSPMIRQCASESLLRSLFIAARRRLVSQFSGRFSIPWHTLYRGPDSIHSPRGTAAAIVTSFGTSVATTIRYIFTEYRLDQGMLWMSTDVSAQQSLGVYFQPQVLLNPSTPHTYCDLLRRSLLSSGPSKTHLFSVVRAFKVLKSFRCGGSFTSEVLPRDQIYMYVYLELPAGDAT